MSYEQRILTCISRAGPLNASVLRESAGIGKHGLMAACKSLLDSRQIVRVPIGCAIMYAAPQHEAELLRQQREYNERVQRAADARAKASAAMKARKEASANRRTGRYQWPDGSNYREPEPIPVSVFHYAQMAVKS